MGGGGKERDLQKECVVSAGAALSLNILNITKLSRVLHKGQSYSRSELYLDKVAIQKKCATMNYRSSDT